jgi:hypothetical protein
MSITTLHFHAYQAILNSGSCCVVPITFLPRELSKIRLLLALLSLVKIMT